MYGAIWRALPGPLLVRLMLAVVLLAAVIVALFTWVFPAVAPLLPLNEPSVGGTG